MNFSDLKRYFSLPVILFISFVFSSIAQAASTDIQAQLTDSSGATGLSIQNSSGNQVARIDSYGDLTAQGNVGVGTSTTGAGGVNVLLYVSPQGWTPEYAVGAGDAYIQNNLEVDGTTYLNDVYINGLEVNGATFQGGQSMDTLTVSGSTYLATISGNVGIGTGVPASRLTVNGGTTIGTGLGYLTTAAPSNGLIVQGNVGIGSLYPGQALDVQGTVRSLGFTTNGAYTQSGESANAFTGVSTFSNATNSALFTGGNVGINSTVPGATLDVQGIIRTTGFTMSGETPISGYVLTASDSSGDTTWTAAGTVSGWTSLGSNVYETDGGNVGIGTSAVTTAALTVMNGNVGIGTWVPAQALHVNGNILVTDGTNGTNYIGAGDGIHGAMSNRKFSIDDGTTVVPSMPGYADQSWGFTANGGGYNFALSNGGTINALSIIQGGNVGIGSTAPGKTLDVQGTIRTTNFAMSGQTPISGYVLTASDSSGDATWTSAGGISAGGWTVSGNNVYETDGGNVGIGTSAVTTAALTVMNGNVGIGTWVPSTALAVNGTITLQNSFAITGSGFPVSNSGIGYSGDSTYLLAGSNGYNDVLSADNIILESMNGTAANVVLAGQNSYLAWTNATSYTTPGTSVGTKDTYLSRIAANELGIGSSQGNISGTLLVGNIGIGSLHPGQALDVQGTIQTTGFTMSGQTPISGYVLTASDSNGDTTWTSPGVSSGWTVSGNNVYETSGGNVGIGTSAVTTAALTVMNGNVGIGTWVPNAALVVNGSAITPNVSGDGFWVTGNAVHSGMYNGGGLDNLAFKANSSLVLTLSDVSAAFSDNVTITGNVGIGSTNPSQALDVQGTIRTTGFTMSGQTPISGYVLTASDSNGDTTWTSPGVSSGWTVSGANVYETSGGNVGIGTSAVTTAALTVMNGNVGIGTWVPGSALTVNGNLNVTSSGNSIISNSSSTNNYLETNNSNGNGIWVGQESADSFVAEIQNLPLQFKTGDVTNMVINYGGNVGIGTTTPVGGLAVMNGNVGIGTWVPGQPLDVMSVARVGNISSTTDADLILADLHGAGDSVAFVMTPTGSDGSGFPANSFNLELNNSSVGFIIRDNQTERFRFQRNGNLGIGSTNPSQALDVQGTIRTTGFTMSGQTPISGYVLTASDSNGDTTWTSPGVSSGWTVSGNNVYETSGGNVGIGTSAVTTAALTVMNGNVGIGTWAPGGELIVQGGNVGIGTNMPPVAFAVGNGAPQKETGPNNAFFGNNVEVAGTLYADLGIVGGQTYSGDLDLNGYYIKSTPTGGNGNGTVLIHGGTGADTPDLVVAPNSYVGIGTTSPASRLTVDGGVAIGNTLSYMTTVAPTGGMIVQGNVGINSTAPGETLDVQGTIRTTNFTMSGQTPISGYVLTASDSNGDTTWTSAGTVGGWTVSGSDVYETSGGNVGIGTTITNAGAALSVMNGNVGIGTWVPGYLLDVRGIINSQVTGTGATSNTSYANFSALNRLNSYPDGQILIGQNASDINIQMSVAPLYSSPSVAIPADLVVSTNQNLTASLAYEVGLSQTTSLSSIYTQWANQNSASATPLAFSPAGHEAMRILTNGNVGIGSTAPGQALDVQGTIRTANFTMSGQTPISGYVLTASDSNGDATWTSAGSISAGGWTVSGNNVYETNGGNVGIGTSVVTTAALTVMNGNVGIGTWVPAGALDVEGTLSKAIFAGNVGIGITNPGQTLSVNGNAQIGSANTTGTALTVQTGSGSVNENGIYVNSSPAVGYTAFTLISNWSSGAGGDVMNIQNAGNNVLLRMNNQGNIGIGTSAPVAKLTVVGNIGIGTVVGDNFISTTPPSGGMIVEGNVGIGTVSPGEPLDVGTARVVSALIVGNANKAGIYPTGANSGIEIQANNSNVMAFPAGGNLGIGAFNGGGGSKLGIVGNLGIGTVSSSGFVLTNAPNGGMLVEGNVGIGSINPGQILDVQGTIRTTGFTMSGQTPVSGYVLTASDSSGDTTWTSAGSISAGGWTVSGNNVYETNGGNVGIGTSAVTTAALTVMNGNVGIGTWVPAGALDVEGTLSKAIFAGNVGIGSTNPTALLSLGGGPAYFNVGNTPIALSLIRSNLTTQNTTIGFLSPTNNWYIGQDVNSSFSFRYGSTNIQSSNQFTINSSGNVGIGTWTPFSSLDVVAGNGVGIGNSVTSSFVTTTAPSGGMLVEGNVGIGSINPGQILDVQGTIRTTGFTMSGQTPISGYVLTASDSSGDTTWTSAGSISAGGWTVSGNNVYETNGGNVGIGTSVVTTAALTVMNGNVGIGTWVPRGALDVNGNIFNSSIYGSWTNDNQSLWWGNWTGTNYQGIAQNVDGNDTISFVQNASSQSSHQLIGFILNTGTVAVYSSGMYSFSNGNNAINGGSFTGQDSDISRLSAGVIAVGTGSQGSTAGTLIANNIGIGSVSPGGKLDVEGTLYPTVFNALAGTLNVGIGSFSPGQKLDVQGTTRTTNFAMTGQSPSTGYVLTASDSSGDATWSTAGSVSGWTVSGNDVYKTASGNVGIGTTITTAGAALTVMNGNVGIGTWAPTSALQINGSVGIGTVSSQSVQIVVPYGTPSVPSYSFAGYTNTGVYSDSSGALRFSVGGTEEALVDTNGIWTNTAEIGLSQPSYISSSVAAGTLYFGSSSDGTNGILIASNIGLGTTTPQGALVVMNGNVGIGSTAPGKTLDVQGTIRTTNFTMSGQTPISGYVLTASDSSGDTTWTSAGSISAGGWTVSGNDVYETNSGNVGIGTSITNAGAALSVMNGNVGIGTWVPAQKLDVQGTISASAFYVSNNANNVFNAFSLTGSTNGQFTVYNHSNGSSSYTQVAGSSYAGSHLDLQSGTGSGTSDYIRFMTGSESERMRIDTNGNVGIGSIAPGQALDVQGTIRTTNFTMSGQTPISGYVLTASDSSGDTTWTSAGSISAGGWTVSGNNVYETNGGNVGIGTSAVTTAALTVMNGNVGIGTWIPGSTLDVEGTISTFEFQGTSFTGVTGTSKLVGSASPQFSGTARLPGITGSSGSTGTFQFETTTAANPTSASYAQFFNTSSTGQTIALDIDNNSNIGIGTVGPNAGKLIVSGGNVGVGSLTPGQALDVQGTIRTTNFTMSGQTPVSGYVLTASDSSGDTTWTSAGSLSAGGWTVSGNNVYETNGGNVGIGTSAVTTAAFTVMNGNVGIGTWVPGGALTVMNGNVGIGTNAPSALFDIYQNGVDAFQASYVTGMRVYPGNAGQSGSLNIGRVGTYPLMELYANQTTPLGVFDNNGNLGIGTTTPAGALSVMSGNVGIGTWVPKSALDIIGTSGLNIESVGTVLSLGSANGYSTQTIAVDSSSNMTFTTSANNSATSATSYLFNAKNFNNGIGANLFQVQKGGNPAFTITSDNGNVGIGTTTPVGGLAVMNGNVGIGTWVPGGALDIEGSGNVVLDGGAVEIGAHNGSTAPYLIFSGYNENQIYLDAQGSYYGDIQSTNANTWSLGYGGAIGVGDLGTSVLSWTNSGNVGIGSTAPGQALDVQGTVRTTGFTMSGQTPVSGYVLTASDSNGDATWTSAGSISAGGWTVSGANVYETSGGNVGIGTTAPTGALEVEGGNVGIGTWAPSSTFSIIGSIAVRTVTVTSGTYAAAANDQVILVNAGSSVTVDLPAVASVPGREYIIKRTDATANTVSIKANASENIDGQNTVSITVQYQSFTIVSDGTQWDVI